MHIAYKHLEDLEAERVMSLQAASVSHWNWYELKTQCKSLYQNGKSQTSQLFTSPLDMHQLHFIPVVSYSE